MTALSEFKVVAVDLRNPTNKFNVKFVQATADFSHAEKELESEFYGKSDKKRVYGPVKFAIDGKADTAWGIDAGRSHHPNCFTMWLAGGGIKSGITIGESDEFGFNVTNDQVRVHDLHATIMPLLGFDRTKLTYCCQGRDFRLTDVHGAVVPKLLA